MQSIAFKREERERECDESGAGRGGAGRVNAKEQATILSLQRRLGGKHSEMDAKGLEFGMEVTVGQVNSQRYTSEVEVRNRYTDRGLMVTSSIHWFRKGKLPCWRIMNTHSHQFLIHAHLQDLEFTTTRP